MKILTGFGSYFESEALEGALPHGQNSPQKTPYNLYAEQISGALSLHQEKTIYVPGCTAFYRRSNKVGTPCMNYRIFCRPLKLRNHTAQSLPLETPTLPQRRPRFYRQPCDVCSPRRSSGG